MIHLSRRFIFSLAIGLVIGWGILFLFLIAASSTMMGVDTEALDRMPVILPSVRLALQVDKKVYLGGDTVLISARNDSRSNIWIMKPPSGCEDKWWKIQQLGNDGETWKDVALTKHPCKTADVTSQQFTNHTVQGATWIAQIPGPQLGDVFINPPTGTYRVVMPYVKSKEPVVTNWSAEGTAKMTSFTFTIQ